MLTDPSPRGLQKGNSLLPVVHIQLAFCYFILFYVDV